MFTSSHPSARADFPRWHGSLATSTAHRTRERPMVGYDAGAVASLGNTVSLYVRKTVLEGLHLHAYPDPSASSGLKAIVEGVEPLFIQVAFTFMVNPT